VLRAKPDEMVQLVGLKGRLLGSLHHVSNQFLVTPVGALFAFYFCTMSQAVFFWLSGYRANQESLRIPVAIDWQQLFLPSTETECIV